MNNTEISKLLEIARINYPKGTAFKSTYQRDKAISTGDFHFIGDNSALGHKDIIGNGKHDFELNSWVYSNDNWAEIISLPENVNNYSYEIY